MAVIFTNIQKLFFNAQAACLITNTVKIVIL